MAEPVHYGVFKELFEVFSINPRVFQKLCPDKITGYFPDLLHRKPKINVTDLVDVLFLNEETNAQKTLRAFARMVDRWVVDDTDTKEVKDAYAFVAQELLSWAEEIGDPR